ncbi:MAG: hypothetical protein KJP14_03260 [Eudoraea sp.]|nr:hypothetical protein [Eudoraea sp.]MBT8209523.1 hypothetical protein [Eudoraea sp.]MBT8222874.1 hypothetical protein [Eudoraea sp.]MBT8322747.1 hypothetical protein [Eudoraea sp.]NNK30413.1 hypothetical protein [Flavobacteriaceae bacterium]
MQKSMLYSRFITLFLLCIAARGLAQEKHRDSLHPLTSFSRLIGGEWHLGDSYQVFDWGVGKLSVNSKSYFVMQGASKLVSEGNWFWHPGEKEIKGYFTAVSMPAVLFDYTTRFETSKMVNSLITYTAAGKREAYTEVWEFVDEDTYKWILYSGDAEEPKKIMEGTYNRKIQNE